MKWLVIFGVILMYRFTTNFVHRWKCKHFFNLYLNNGKDKDWNLIQHQDEIVELFKKADIEDAFVPYVEPVGYGYVTNTKTSVFLNLPSDREDITLIVLTMFQRVIGVFSKRAKETFSLLFWIDFILNLPKKTLKYIGVPAENVLVKISQVLYWIFATIISFFIIFFKPETTIFLKKLSLSLFG